MDDMKTVRGDLGKRSELIIISIELLRFYPRPKEQNKNKHNVTKKKIAVATSFRSDCVHVTRVILA